MRLRSLLASSTVLVGFLAFPGCGNYAMQSGSPEHVSLYSGGKLVREWITVGNVYHTLEDPVIHFIDSETRNEVHIVGTIVSEPAAEK